MILTIPEEIICNIFSLLDYKTLYYSRIVSKYFLDKFNKLKNTYPIKIYNNNIFIDKDNVREISCGSNHVVILTHNNEIYSFGDNTHGQCGAGKGTNKVHDYKVKIHGKVNNVICENNLTVATTISRHIYVFGNLINSRMVGFFNGAYIYFKPKIIWKIGSSAPIKYKKIILNNGIILILNLDGKLYNAGVNVKNCFKNNGLSAHLIFKSKDHMITDISINSDNWAILLK